MSETPQRGSHAQGADKLQKQASQLAYDVKYKVRQSLGKDTRLSPAQVTKAYAAQLAKSPAPPAVKALAKKKLLGEEYTSDIKNLAEKSAVNAMFKVFVEGIEEKVDEEVVVEEETSGERTYKVRVTDKKTGNTYVRNATRTKISELRSNPNISSVEMTGYGEPIKSEKTKGAQTAAVKAGKDYDGDGKVESSSKEHAGVVHNAIQRSKGGTPDGKDTRKTRKEEVEVPSGNLKKLVARAVKRIDSDVDGDVDSNDPKAGDFGEFVPSPDGKKRVYTKIKEDFLGEVKEDKEKNKKLDVMKKGKNNVTIFPEVKEETMTDSDKKKEKRLKKKYDKSEMKKNMMDQYGKEKGEKVYFATIRKQAMDEECGVCDKCGKNPCECESDSREKPTKMDLLKNKMRARGIKVASLTPAPRNMKTSDEIEESKSEQIDEVAPLAVGAALAGLAAAPAVIKHVFKPKADKALQRGKNELHLKGNPIGSGARGLSNSYELEGEVVESAPAPHTPVVYDKKMKGYVPAPGGVPGRASKKATTQVAGYEPEGEMVEGYVSVEDGVIYLEGNQGPSTPVRIYTFPDGSKRVQPTVGGMIPVRRVKKDTKPTTQMAGYELEGEMTEEASDRKRDRRQERGGVDANVDYSRPPAKKATNKELGIREMTPEEREKRRKEIAAHLKKMRR